MVNLSLTDYFSMLRDAVRFYPESPASPCLQPGAFRVLPYNIAAGLPMDNLGAVYSDRTGPFFYSRKWEREMYNPNSITFDWPVVTTFELFGETTSSPFTGAILKTYSLEIACLDVWRENCNELTGCGARSINQIYIDTETILDSVLKYIAGMVIATTNVDATERLYYQPFLDAAVIDGTITGYNVVKPIAADLQPINMTLRYSRVELTAQKVYGTRTRIDVRVSDCETIDFVQGGDYGIKGHEQGCENC